MACVIVLGQDTPRGFIGELSNLRTPHGLATIKSTAAGRTITLQAIPAPEGSAEAL
jgi:hypothetical protein